MVSRTQTRRLMDKTIHILDPKKKKITWEMSTFRHAVLNSVDSLPTLKAIKWEFNWKRQITTCNFIFGKQTIQCSYSLFTKKVTLWNETTEYFEMVPVEDFPKTIKAHAPKAVKLILKRKTEVK